jgi:hypothetical protein
LESAAPLSFRRGGEGERLLFVFAKKRMLHRASFFASPSLSGEGVRE